MPEPVLFVQGGAGRAVEPARAAELAASLRVIADAAWALLERSATAVDAVVEAVRRLEDDPLYNAGTGAKLQVDGVARLSASLMDGARERFAGVVNVEGIGNPVRLCRHLLDEEDRVLSGEGARHRACALGIPEVDVRTARSLEAWRRGLFGETGTVGAVALDARGHLAAATSTGGRGLEAVGRVSDSCMPAGNFATNGAAVSFTGVGEEIIDGGLGVRLVAAVEAGATLDDAADAVIARMTARGWRGGFIAVDAGGRWAVRRTTAAMSWRVVTPDGSADFRGGADWTRR